MSFKNSLAHRALLIASALSMAVSSAECAVAAEGAQSKATVAGQPGAAKPAPILTVSQKNAVRSAKSYLRISGFSRQGLIEQLSSSSGDGYAEADAIAAVDSLDVDWNENAARSAKDYLKISGFSCKGLVEQLSSDAGDKYTEGEANYGAQQAGVCP